MQTTVRGQVSILRLCESSRARVSVNGADTASAARRRWRVSLIHRPLDRAHSARWHASIHSGTR